MNFQHIHRAIRRLIDSPLPRQLNRRIAVVITIIFVFIFYFFISQYSTPTSTAAEICVIGHFEEQAGKRVKLDEETPVSFTGNGYIGLDVSDSGTLLLQTNRSTGFHRLSGFLPLVHIITPSSDDKALKFVSDVHEGISKAVKCSIISGHCACVYEHVYAHRTRPNILVQDIKFSNPSLSPINVKFERTISSDWERQEGSKIPIYFRTFNFNNQPIHVAVICSSLPGDAAINQKREESFRFFCVIEHNMVGSDSVLSKRELLARAVNRFSDVNGAHWNQVDTEHKDAWAKLNKAYFNISVSKAPNALNSNLIELTKHLLLSSVRDPLIEKDANPAAISNSKGLLDENELCYGGHSTMLTPSRLWQHWNNLDDVLGVVNVWLLTLSTHGCMNLVEAGAHGLLQAFLLSLTSARFTHHYLEFTLDPVGDLHRSLHVEGLEYIPDVPITIDFDMDDDLRPFIQIKGSSSYKTPIFACSGGCIDEAKQVTDSIIQLPIKITKPPTPILFISSDKNVLKGLKNTLHVIDVADAPKHSAETISLHKHGENTGLPTAFWIILICLLVSFHVFLFKLLYSEWKNSSNMPYTKFSKKILLRRKAKLGDECDRDSDCENKGSICLRGVCQCHPFYVRMSPEKGLDRCIRLPAKIGADCSTKCREPLFCRNGKCQCVQRGSTSIRNGECVSVSQVGDRCSRHYDCTSAFSACVNHQCVCISGTVQQGTKCVASTNCPFGGQPMGSCVRRAATSQIPNFVEGADNCPVTHMCITTPDSAVGHCCPKVCPLGTAIDTSYSCLPGNSSLVPKCPSDTHFCHYLSGDSFAQGVCCKRPCNSMAPEALYLDGECVARGQHGSECRKHEQCGAAEGMECHSGTCRCANGFQPDTDELTNPLSNPSQKCIKTCNAGSLSRDTACLNKSPLGGPCFVQAQCPDNAGCYRGRCLCKCDHRPNNSNKCIKIPTPTTPKPPPGPFPHVPGLTGSSQGGDLLSIFGNFGNLFTGGSAPNVHLRV